MMLSLLIIISITFTIYVEGCSPPFPQDGTYYISKAELLSETAYPDSLLLTISRITDTFSENPRLTFSDPSGGPWCKIMNVRDGSVGGVVTCDDYTKSIRAYSTADTDPASTTVSCSDNCDGMTATCTINRYNIDYTITDIPYSDSDPAGCGPTTTSPPFVSIGGTSFFNSFALDMCNVYILFTSNTVGLNFCVRNINGYIISNVSRTGEGQFVTGWQYLEPNGYFADSNPSIYSSVNVIQTALPCCLCYGWSLNVYSIASDPTGAYDQIFTLNHLTNGGNIDTVKQRAFSIGLGFSTSVTVYDLSAGTSETFEPDLCDVIVNCLVSPCSVSTCPYNPTATCVDDYCGGCNARWFCGNWEITNDCDQEPASTQICPTPTSQPTSSPTQVCGDCYGLTLLTEGVDTAGNQCYRYRANLCQNVTSIRLGLGNADRRCRFDLQTAFVSLQPARLTYNLRVNGRPNQRGIEIFGLNDGDAFRICLDATQVVGTAISGNVEFDNGVTEEVCPISNVLPEFCPVFAANMVNEGEVIQDDREWNTVNNVNEKEPMRIITFVWTAIVAFVISMIVVYVAYIVCFRRLKNGNGNSKKTQVYDEESEDEEIKDEAIEDDAEKDII